MLTTSVRFPVVCPECGGEALAAFPAADLCAALLVHAPLPLRAPCHGRTWNANNTEREQIREYLAALGPAAAERVSLKPRRKQVGKF